MYLNFQKIKVENFLSLGNIDLDLFNKGYCLVEGVNKSPVDNAKSNGSGKSSIFDAILWVLTGETTRGVSNIRNIHSSEGCKVELQFQVGGDYYSIIRTRDYKELGSNLKIFINGEDKSGKGLRDTEKLLEQYLPDLTSNLISSVIILGQGLPQRFTNNTPSGRKEILEKLSKSDFMIEDIKEKIIKRISVLNNKIRVNEDSILKNNTTISILKENLELKTKSLLNYENKEELNNSIIKYEEELNHLVELAESSTLDIFTWEKNLDSLNIENTNLQLELSSKINSLNEEYHLATNNILIKKQSLINDFQNIDNEIKRLKSIKDVCPTCGQKIPGVVKQDTSIQERKLIGLQNIIDSCDQALDSYKKQFLNSKENIEKDFNSKISAKEKEIQEGRSYLKTCREKSSEYSQNIEALNIKIAGLKKEIALLEENSLSLKKDIEKLTEDLSALNDKNLYINNENQELNSRLDIVNGFLNIAKREFRGYLLSNIISYLGSKAKEYCKDIFSSDRISFELQGNSLSISYDGKAYENLSGGEKQKIDIIIQFAIRDMLCQFSNFSSNILVLDEIFDNVDSFGAEKIINFISIRLQDIESIFIITHHSDIPICYDNIITIIKNEQGISNLK